MNHDKASAELAIVSDKSRWEKFTNATAMEGRATEPLASYLITPIQRMFVMGISLHLKCVG